jgi:hypothetical protein
MPKTTLYIQRKESKLRQNCAIYVAYIQIDIPHNNCMRGVIFNIIHSPSCIEILPVAYVIGNAIKANYMVRSGSLLLYLEARYTTILPQRATCPRTDWQSAPDITAAIPYQVSFFHVAKGIL